MMTEELERLYRPTDIARELGVLPSAVSNWQVRGKLPKPDYRLGPRSVLWRAATIHPFIRAYKEGFWIIP